jgi:hypothetical protein
MLRNGYGKFKAVLTPVSRELGLLDRDDLRRQIDTVASAISPRDGNEQEIIITRFQVAKGE